MTTTVTVAAPRPAPFFTPVFMAIEKFLPEEGIEGKIEYGVHRARVQQGEIDYVATGVGRGGFLEPTGLVLVGQHETRATTHTLMVRPDIGTADRISTLVMTTGAAPGSDDLGLDRELTNVLLHYQIQLEDSDISLHRVDGGHPYQYRALQEGIGDGAILGAPWWLFLFKQGYVNLGCEADYRPGFGCGGVLVPREKVEKDPQQVQAFVRAYVKAVRFCRENPDETIELMLRWSKEWGVDDESIAREMYRMLSPYWDEHIDPAVIQRLLERTAEQTGKPLQPVESVLDTRFLEEALEEAHP